ncbi:MAG TPA: hypothetical protein VMB34_33815 [Acetobacteraceae bacterium]|nr:hypothetical protein [Acetobacteraceae bacterium]
MQDDAYAGPVRRVVFDRHDQLFSAAADGKIRGYDGDGHRMLEREPEPGLRP